MLAIAALCKMKGWSFDYYTKPISKRVKEQEYGNLYESKILGMGHIEIENDMYQDYISALRVNVEANVYLLDQGGADTLAEDGIKELAKEIKDASLSTKVIALPSGTGTTALYLALALREYRIYTVACIGDTEYLKEQMQALSEIPDNLIILESSQKYHFAKPYKEFYGVYKKLLESGIEFDLLYAPLMWKTLLEYDLENVLYIHSGGVSGNKSMLERYKKKNISENVEIL